MAVAASLLMLPSCSNDSVEVGADLPDAPVFVPGDSEVEILLGSATGSNVEVDKRAALENDADIKGMGVFCLAREKQEINPGAYDITWFSASGQDWSACLMKNVEANKRGNGVYWADDTKHYYYPISQFYRYDFYGYYPYVNDGNIRMENNKVEVDYAMDGKTDIIWGRASSDEQYAYSAAYFRQPGNEDKYPRLDLRHVMTRLKFKVMPGAQVEGGSTVASSMVDYAVARVMVVDVPATVTLTVADFNRIDDLDETNCLTPSVEKAEYVLCKADDTPMDTTMVGVDMDVATPLGESLLVMPASEYTVRVYLVNVKTGDVFVTEHPLKLSNNSTFLPGYTYTVTITAHEPKEVMLQANVNPWQDAEDNPSLDL